MTNQQLLKSIQQIVNYSLDQKLQAMEKKWTKKFDQLQTQINQRLGKLLDLLEPLILIDLAEVIDDKLTEKLSKYPTKDEFAKMMDRFTGELKTIREEHTVFAHQNSQHHDRLEKLEQIHPNFSHS